MKWAVVLPLLLLALLTHAVRAAIPVNGCMTLDQAGATYQLTRSFSTGSIQFCFIITGNGITFEGDGKFVEHSSQQGSLPTVIVNAANVRIQNMGFTTPYNAIHIQGSSAVIANCAFDRVTWRAVTFATNYASANPTIQSNNFIMNAQYGDSSAVWSDTTTYSVGTLTVAGNTFSGPATVYVRSLVYALSCTANAFDNTIPPAIAPAGDVWAIFFSGSAGLIEGNTVIGLKSSNTFVRAIHVIATGSPGPINVRSNSLRNLGTGVSNVYGFVFEGVSSTTFIRANTMTGFNGQTTHGMYFVNDYHPGLLESDATPLYENFRGTIIPIYGNDWSTTSKCASFPIVAAHCYPIGGACNAKCRKCPPATFSDDCIPCDASCSACSGTATSCTTCTATYYRREDETGNSNCYNTVPAGFYLDTNIYRRCDASCQACSGSATTCTTCAPSYYRKEGDNDRCYNTPPTGYYFDVSSSTYKPCDVSCATCDSSSACTTCSLDYYPKEGDNGLCYSNPAGYYFDDTSSTYKLCDVSCVECSGTATTCTTCANSYYRKDGDTDQRCYNNPAGFYLDGSLYKPCDASCSACSGTPTACTTCNSNYYRKEGDNDNCYNTPPSGYYLDTPSSTYKPCDVSCGECTGTSTSCTTCATNYYRKQGDTDKCYSNPSGFYLDGSVYKPCDASCGTCSGSPTTCTTCATNYYRKEGDTQKCYNTVPGYYLDGSTYKPCDASCTACAGEATTCTTCASGYYRKQGDTQKCYNTAPAKHYLDGSVYRPCDASCARCSGSAINCGACAPNYFRKEGDTQKCYSSPPGPYYLDSATSIYKACDMSCGSCSGPTTCTTCATNYYRKQGDTDKCYSNPSGYFLDGSVYKQCNVSCASCSGAATTCTACAPNYYRKEGDTQKCYNTMPAGYFLDGSTYKPCNTNCKTCNGTATRCTSCGAPTPLLYNQQCLTQCPNATTPVNQICTPCTDNCAQCTPTPSTCTACSGGYGLDGTRCVLECSGGKTIVNNVCTTPSTTTTTSSQSSSTTTTGTDGIDRISGATALLVHGTMLFVLCVAVMLL